jgi:hypothetical protein
VKKGAFQYLARPWILESLFFFLTLWQESFRLSARTSGMLLPIDRQLQNFYYYNFGDFVNGYVIAFIADGVTNLILLKKRVSYTAAGFKITNKGFALLATLFSVVTVVIFEVTQSASTTSDINDIPAGILGALLYYLIRLLALKIALKHSEPAR